MDAILEKLNEFVTKDTPLWLALGLCGNLCWGTRFLVQWIASEKAGRVVVPKAFWYLSILGTLILCVYAIHDSSLVFTIAYAPNAFVYVRNLMIERKFEQSNGGADRHAHPADRPGKVGAGAPQGVEAARR